MSSVFNVYGIFAPVPAGTVIGPGTAWPFGLTAAQLVDSMVNTETYAVSSSGPSGVTGARTLPTFPGTGLSDKAAFFYTSILAFTDNSIADGTGQVTLQINAGPGYFDSSGLFYPGIILQLADAMGNVAATIGAGTTVGVASWFGAPAPMITSDPITSASLSVSQGSAF